MSRSPAQAETAQDSDRKESKARSRDLLSISPPVRKGHHRTPRQRPSPTNNRSFSFLLSQWTLRLTLRHKSLSLGERAMRHFSVLLSAQSTSNLKTNDQPLLAPTRAATLKTATPAKTRLMRGIATAAILLLTIPPITDAAEAGPGGGGGGRGGGFGGHAGVSARGFAGRGGGLGFVGGPVGGARIGGRGIGSLGTSHF